MVIIVADVADFFTFRKTDDCGKMIRCLMENAKEFGSKRQGVLKKCLDVFKKRLDVFTLCIVSFSRN